MIVEDMTMEKQSSDDITEEQIKQLEEDLKKIDPEGSLSDSSFSSPSPEKKDSTLVLFRELIESKDSRKFGNLDNKELGNASMSVRDQLDIANYLESEGLTKLSEYMQRKAEIIFATSLSKNAKLIDNLITQIKKEQKLKEAPPTEKRGFFNFGKKQEAEEP